MSITETCPLTAKDKIDMLCKDKSCKLADGDFKLTLHVETVNPAQFVSAENSSSSGKEMISVETDAGMVAPDVSLLKAQADMIHVFQEHGTLHEFHKGEYVLQERTHTGSIMLVEQGLVEVVVLSSNLKDGHEVKQQIEYHPCGINIPDELTAKLGQERVPINMVQGRGSILGLSNFLAAPQTLVYRARTGKLSQIKSNLNYQRADFHASDVTLRVLSNTMTPLVSPIYPGNAASASLNVGNSDSGKYLGEKDNLTDIPERLSGETSRKEPDDISEEDDEELGPYVRNASKKISAQERHDSPGHRQSIGRQKSFYRRIADATFRRRHDTSSRGSKAKGYLVRKRLNRLQTWWRVIVIDAASGSILNKQLSSLDTHSSLDESPVVSQEEMLTGAAILRKRIDISAISQVINFSSRSSKTVLKFKTQQRPYEIEFLSSLERDDFSKTLSKLIPKSFFSFREPPRAETSNILDSHFTLECGLDEISLSNFWQGVALKMAHILDRTRTECIRISRLKALSDKSSFLSDHNEEEQLRLDCIQLFRLPATEKLDSTAKVWILAEDMRVRTDTRMRLLVLADHIVLDRAIFGPAVSKDSIILRLDQLYQVYDPYNKQESDLKFCVKVLCEIGGTEELIEIRIGFGSAATYHQIREQVTELTKRAHDLRWKQRERPLLDRSFF